MKIPKAAYSFGDRVVVHWEEQECQPTEAIIIGINYNPRKRGTAPLYTVIEDNGEQTSDIPENTLVMTEPANTTKRIDKMQNLLNHVLANPIASSLVWWRRKAQEALEEKK